MKFGTDGEKCRFGVNSYKAMELDKIGAELEQLSVMVGGWRAAGRIDELERDLALEKLRRIYEAVRFAAPLERNTESESEQPVEVPVNLDLDRMLGIMPLTEEEPGELIAGSQLAEERDGLSADSAAEESAPKQEAAVAPAPQREEPVEQPGVDSALQEAVMPEPEQNVAAAPEAVPVSEPVRETVSEPVAGPVPEPAASQPAAVRQTVIEPALFGMDEIVQHKRKQRVIMSLYDEHPGTARPASEPVAKPEPLPLTEPKPVREEPEAAAEPAATPEPLPEPLRINETEPETQPEEATESVPAAPESDREPENKAAAETPAQVLGEVINRGVQTLGETIAPPRDAVSDMAHKTPVTDLREAIGINDKFLLIRDLFDGDAAACDAAIDTLNGFDDLDDCMIHIAEHYAWNPNSDGARLLVELLERKLA